MPKSSETCLDFSGSERVLSYDISTVWFLVLGIHQVRVYYCSRKSNGLDLSLVGDTLKRLMFKRVLRIDYDTRVEGVL